MFGSLFDKEQITKDTIQVALQSVAEELNVDKKPDFHKEFFISIMPADGEYNFRCFIMQKVNNAPKMIREITVAEIVGED